MDNKVSRTPVVSHYKDSKETRKQVGLRNARIRQEANLSSKLSKAQQLLDEGIVERVEDTRTFTEKQADELFQKEEGLKNAKKLLEDNGEASSFNTNYKDVGSYDAFKLIRKMLNDMANQEANKPMSNKDFISAMEKIIKKLTPEAQNDPQQQDMLHRVEALAQTRIGLDEAAQQQFDEDLGVNEENMADLASSVVQGLD